jgi:2-polyprenyl-3-methyl-5-hydroxy-6-metoxy-1,4-benzoquinol methylase
MTDNAKNDARVIEKIAGFFNDSRWLRGYVRGKLRTDPAYRAVLEELQERPQPVLDIGCGLGLLSFYLREQGLQEPIMGVDCDAPKIKRATEIAAREYSGLDFGVCDAREVSAQYGAVVILDVLHYLEDASQRRLLEDIADKVPEGGVVIIRNAPKDGSLRYRLTYLEELFVRAVGWIRGGGVINFPTKDAVAAPFRARGFSEEIRPLWGRTPFNSYLFVFRR